LRDYLLQFGPHPLVGAMVLQGTPPEVLIENSRRMIQKLNKNGRLVEFEESMTYADALAQIARARELVAPYIEGKAATQVDLTVQHDGLLVIGGVTHSHSEVQNIIDGQFLPIDDEETAA
jgi:sulfur carrier protein ThiS